MSSLKRETDLSHARAAVARATRTGVRSTQEVATYLRHRGYPEAVVKSTLTWCRAHRVIDDHACARLWADHWARQGYASLAIQARLAAKGLSNETIELALSSLDSDDRQRASTMVARRTRRQPMAPRQRAQVARVLAARGFDTDLIEQVLS